MLVLALLSAAYGGGEARADWAVGAVPPQNILYISNQTGFVGNSLSNALMCMGHSVTRIELPGLDGFTDELAGMGLTLDDFDQVWDNRFADTAADAITAADATAFNNYLANGGSLFLCGENSGFPERNNSLVQYLNDYINLPGYISSEYLILRPYGAPKASEPLTSQGFQVTCIYGRCMNFNQDFIVLGNRFFYLFEMKDIR